MNHLHDIEAIYHQRRRIVIKRYRRNSSGRITAGNLDVSHPTVMKIVNDPDYMPSKKLMLRIIKATTARMLPTQLHGHFKKRIPGCPK